MKTLMLMLLTVTAVLFAGTVQVLAVHESDSNTWVGNFAGHANPSGFNNTFIGNLAGQYTSIGGTNTFVGSNAGTANTSGDYNTFVGAWAGNLNTNYIDNTHNTGNHNTFIGYDAGSVNTIGSFNTFVGDQAGLSNSADHTAAPGNGNTYIGGSAGWSNRTGSGNTAIGSAAGYNNVSGSNNVYIGPQAGFSATGDNKLYIDNCHWSPNPSAPCDSPLIYGEFDHRVLNVNGTVSIISSVSPSDGRLKKNIMPLDAALEKILHLQGVSYEWRVEENPGKGFGRDRQIGLIAQEVEKVIPELVHTDGKGYKAVAYDKLVPVLIEAMKEQQREIKDRDARIERLERALEIMERRMSDMESPTKTVAMK